MTIENMEAQLDELRKIDESLMLMLALKEIDSHDKSVPQLIKLHYPKLEMKCRGLLEVLIDHTIENGFCSRTDFIKDTTFEIFGKVIGEQL